MVASWVSIEGADRITAVVKALRHLGVSRTIARDMQRRISRSAPPLRRAVRKSARTTLPKRGGLGKWVSEANIRTVVIRSAIRAGVSLIVGKNSRHGRTEMVRMDQGMTRHPLFGRVTHWYSQSVTPGFATRVMDGPEAEQFHRDALAAVDIAVDQVVRELG